MIWLGTFMIILTITAKALLDNNIRKSAIWKQLKNFTLFNTFVPGVNKITLTKDNSKVTAEWFITIDGVPFTWLEVVNFDEHNFTVDFEAVCGDFDKWYGEWTLVSTTQGNFAIEFKLNYRLGIPVVENVVGSILNSKIQKFIDTMVNAHAERLMLNTLDTRNGKRIKLNKDVEFIADNRAIDAKILDFSSGGLKMKLRKELLTLDGCKSVDFSFANVRTQGCCILDANTEIVRIVFSKSLSNQEITSILSQWQTGDLLTDEMVKIYDVVTSKLDVSKSQTKVS
jgi:ribosome-associated toxin RatA of RatAB toxin-antitoxin module